LFAARDQKNRKSMEKTLELSDLTLTVTQQQTHQNSQEKDFMLHRNAGGRQGQSQEGIQVLTALVAQLQ